LQALANSELLEMTTLFEKAAQACCKHRVDVSALPPSVIEKYKVANGHQTDVQLYRRTPYTVLPPCDESIRAKMDYTYQLINNNV
jgi:hypothetical protein